MFRIWPSFARKNYFLVFSYRTKKGFTVHVPLPLFIVDGVIESLSILLGIGVGRVFVAARFARCVPYIGALGIGGRSIGEAWQALRWRGAFTLFDVDVDQSRFSVRFI